MAASVSSFTASALNSTATPKTVTTLSWTAGDVIVVIGGAETADTTLNTPTNANLTFALQASNTAGGAGDCDVYVWRAVAGSTQTGQTISCSRGATSGQWGFFVWVDTGVSSTANPSANLTESNFTFTPSAGSIVHYAFFDWNANNTDQTIATGTGTATERADSRSAAYGWYAGDWVGVTATSTAFGITDFTGLRIAHGVIEVLASAGATNVDADPATLALTGVDVTAAGTGAAPVAADPATLSLTGVDSVLVGSGAASIAADPAALTFTGVEVTAATGASGVTVDPATLTFTGVDATLAGTGATSVAADSATIAFSGVDATLAAGATGVTADTAILTFTGVTPTLAGSGATSTAADVAVLVLSGVDVTVSASADVSVDAAVLILTGVDVIAAGSGTTAIIADTATLTLSAVTPTLTGVGAVTRTVDPAVLTFTGIEVGAFTGQLLTPTSRTWTIPADPRTLLVDDDARTWTITADIRTLTVPSSLR